MKDCQVPAWFSCFPAKLELYAVDRHFRIGWNAVARLLQSGEFCLDHFWHLGSVLFRPDSMLRRNSALGIRLLKSHGFQVTAARIVHFDAQQVRDFWAYSAGRFSDERLSALEDLMLLTGSLYLVVRAPRPDPLVPAAVTLTELKGQAVPALRRPGDLRFEMGTPQSAFFSFVHTADEPADLVRELGILFPSSEIAPILMEAIAPIREDSTRLCNEITARSPLSGLSLNETLTALVNRLCQTTDSDKRGLIDGIERIQHGHHELWPLLRSRIQHLGIFVDKLDEVVISGSTAPRHRQHKTEAFPSCERRYWLAATPRRG